MITDEEHHTSVDAMTEALLDMTGHRDDLIRRLADAEEERDRLRTDLAERTAQLDVMRNPIDAECVEHVELTGHIDIAQQCRDYLAHEAIDDSSGKLHDFVEALGVVIQQLDRQRRRANWYEAAYDAGKAKLIEAATKKTTAERDALLAEVAELKEVRRGGTFRADETIEMVKAAPSLVHLDDPIDPYPSDLVGKLARAVVALNAESFDMGSAALAAHCEYKQRRNEQFAAYEALAKERDMHVATITRLKAETRLDVTRLDELNAEVARLRALINTPQTADFVEAMKVEAAHQVERWGVEHDAGKRPEDWIALVAYLLGKATKAHFDRDRAKPLHHVVTLAAVALNWHRNMTGESTAMRPGIGPRTPVGIEELQRDIVEAARIWKRVADDPGAPVWKFTEKLDAAIDAYERAAKEAT